MVGLCGLNLGDFFYFMPRSISDWPSTKLTDPPILQMTSMNIPLPRKSHFHRYGHYMYVITDNSGTHQLEMGELLLLIAQRYPRLLTPSMTNGLQTPLPSGMVFHSPCPISMLVYKECNYSEASCHEDMLTAIWYQSDTG